MTEQNERFTGWAVVEMLGHKKLAGFVSEQVIAGSALVRVDVPETLQRKAVAGYGGSVVESKPGYTKLIGVGSIYCITPTDESTARRAAAELERWNEPIPVALPALLSAGGSSAQPEPIEAEWEEEQRSDEEDLPL
jgi:hypothetical protein